MQVCEASLPCFPMEVVEDFVDLRVVVRALWQGLGCGMCCM